jgi:hypothetical protein
LAGAEVLLNLSASNITIGKADALPRASIQVSPMILPSST